VKVRGDLGGAVLGSNQRCARGYAAGLVLKISVVVLSLLMIC